MDNTMRQDRSAQPPGNQVRRRISAARQRQRGMTFIGLLCILALVGTIGYAGLRLVPVYLNYMKVARSMDVTAVEFKGENPDQGGMRRSLEKHWQIEDISSVDVKDVEILKDEAGGVSMHVAYDDSVPYAYNVSLSVHFDKTVKVQ
jgi:hypothetical protein